MLFLSLDVCLPPHQSHPPGNLQHPPHRSLSWSANHNEWVFPLSNLEPWHRHSHHCIYPPVHSNNFLSTSSLDWKLSPQGQGPCLMHLSLQCLPQSLGWCEINGWMKRPMSRCRRFQQFQCYPPPPHRTSRAHVMPHKIPHLPLTSLRTPRVFPSATSPKEIEPWLSWGMAWSHSGHPDPLP